MKEPIVVAGKYFFPETRQTVDKAGDKRCMICNKFVAPSAVISACDPNRRMATAHTEDGRVDNTPRIVNHLPPRPVPDMFQPPQHLERVELRLKSWLHLVARTKTIPRDFVCGEECEQHAVYGRLFTAHPLEPSNVEQEDSDSSSGEEDG